MRDQLQLVVYRERSLVNGALDSSLVAFGRPVVQDTLWKGHSQTDVSAVEDYVQQCTTVVCTTCTTVGEA